MTHLFARLLLLLAAGASLVLAACGDAGTTDRKKAQVRLVNASVGYAALDLREEGAVRQGGVAYGGSASYVQVDPTPDELSVHAAGSSTALVSTKPSLERNHHYTLLAFGNAGALRTELLDDEAGEPDSGRTQLRVVNAAPDAGTVDVYLTEPSEAIAGAVPLAGAAEFGKVGGWLTVNSGSWRLRVAAAGSKTDIRLDIPTLELGSKQVLTLVLAPAGGALLVNALGLVQRGDVNRLDGTQARVRAVAGAAGGGAVSAAVAGTTLMSGVGSPAVGAYQLVAAGSVRPVLAIDGVSFPGPSTTLQAGADYTLLVRGSPTAPGADWLADDNRLPAVANQARIRLVNGATGASGPLAMTIDFLPVADAVGPGTASGYAATDASTAARIAVTAAGTATPLFLVPDQIIATGAVYSVFVVGDAAAPAGIVRKDR